jgi:hypothetical protein
MNTGIALMKVEIAIFSVHKECCGCVPDPDALFFFASSRPPVSGT